MTEISAAQLALLRSQQSGLQNVPPHATNLYAKVVPVSGNFVPSGHQPTPITRASIAEIDVIEAARARLSAANGDDIWKRPVDPAAAEKALEHFLAHVNGVPLGSPPVFLDRPYYPSSQHMRDIVDFVGLISVVSSCGYICHNNTESGGWMGLSRRLRGVLSWRQPHGDDWGQLVHARGRSAEWMVKSVQLAMAALDAGVWLYVNPVDGGSPAFCTRPVVKMNDAWQFHCTDGPAVFFPDLPEMPRVYMSNGVTMLQRWVENRDQVTADEVSSQTNAEQRRELMKLIGYDRYVREGGFRLLSTAEREFGRAHVPKGLQNAKLWRKVWREGMSPLRGPGSITFSGTETIEQAAVLLELQNSSKEPDGSYKTYFLRVPPDMRKVADAAAWTFDMKGSEYRGLAAET